MSRIFDSMTATRKRALTAVCTLSLTLMALTAALAVPVDGKGVADACISQYGCRDALDIATCIGRGCERAHPGDQAGYDACVNNARNEEGRICL